MTGYLSERNATAPSQEPVMPRSGFGVRSHDDGDHDNLVDMGEESEDFDESGNVTFFQQPEVRFPQRHIYTPADRETRILVVERVTWRNRFSEKVSSFLEQHDEISNYLDRVEPKIVSVFGECEIRLEIVSYNETGAYDELSANILCSRDWELEMDRLERLDAALGPWPPGVGEYFKFDLEAR